MKSSLSRITIALTLAAFLMADSVGPARAQVSDAENKAEQAEAARDTAYSLVDSASAERDKVEAELAEAMLRYNDSAERLSAANTVLIEIEDALAAAELEAQGLDGRLAEQTVAAYMNSVGQKTELLINADLSSALLASHILEMARDDTDEVLADLTAQKQHLEALRMSAEQEREQVAALTAELEAETERLNSLFAEANQGLSDAIRKARKADADYRAALSAVEKARAQATAKTKPPTSDNSGSKVGKVTPKARVLAWRPLVEKYFAPDLVESALVIMQCESLGDPKIVNTSSGASGLFQFMPGTWATASVKAGVSDRSVFDGEANIIAASWLAEYYRARGYNAWRPWSCRVYVPST